MTYYNDPEAQQHPSDGPTPSKKNRVREAYKNAVTFGSARWGFSIPVLGLCAIQFADGSGLTYNPYVATLIYNLACAGVHLLIPGPPVRQRSRVDPRPPLWYTVLLVMSLLAWIPAFSLLFAMSKNRQAGNYGEIALRKRKIRTGGWDGGSTPFTQTIAAGALGVAITIFNLGNAFYVVKLHRGNFAEGEIAEADDRAARTWWQFGRS